MRSLLVIVGTLLTVTARLEAQDELGGTVTFDATNPPKLRLDRGDDFETDSRNEYRMVGDVTWESGSLKLESESAMQRDLDAGPWVKVDIDLDQRIQGDRTSASIFHIRFQLQGATDCFVSLKAEHEGDVTNTSVAVFDTSEKGGDLHVRELKGTPHVWEPTC